MRVTKEGELEALREGGTYLAHVMQELVSMVAPGVSTEELNKQAEKFIRDGGDTPAFLNYQPYGAARPYPATLCTSVNNQVVHGIPNEDPYILKDGDVITLDTGIVHNGFVTDMAFTVGVGTIDEKTQKLIDAAREALVEALKVARAGNTTGDIGHAVETAAKKYGYSVPTELGGHGVGEAVHEEPFIPNFGTPGSGARLEEGMILAIEPIIIEGNGAIFLESDGYTYSTKDGSRATQFEHTVRITNSKPEVLTQE